MPITRPLRYDYSMDHLFRNIIKKCKLNVMLLQPLNRMSKIYCLYHSSFLQKVDTSPQAPVVASSHREQAAPDGGCPHHPRHPPHYPHRLRRTTILPPALLLMSGTYPGTIFLSMLPGGSATETQACWAVRIYVTTLITPLLRFVSPYILYMCLFLLQGHAK